MKVWCSKFLHKSPILNFASKSNIKNKDGISHQLANQFHILAFWTNIHTNKEAENILSVDEREKTRSKIFYLLMQEWRHQMRVQVQMWNGVELSLTSLILGAQAEAKMDNLHDKHVDILAHLHSTFHNDMNHLHTCVHTFKHACTLAEALTHSHYASHNYMTSLWTYLHSHSHTHVHLTYTFTFTLHNCTLADTPIHSNTNTHQCTNLAHLHMWLSQFLYYNANLKFG